MDKTLEIIIAATVIPLTAGLIMFMVSGQSGDFQNWLNNTQGGAERSLQQTNHENACNCGSGDPNNPDSDQIRAEATSCNWINKIDECEDVYD